MRNVQKLEARDGKANLGLERGTILKLVRKLGC
jgi:hypothetical protein